MHEDWASLDKLLDREDHHSFDFVFVSGDQANGENVIGELADPAANQVHEASNRRIMETLQVMLKSQDTGKVLYIPGNHDAEILFKPEEQVPINDNCVNLHGKVLEIAPGLVIAGLGGSLPTLFKQDGASDFVECFTPYPFASEAHY